nr:MAG TPA: peptidoglycan hydrolase [Bacteriophage sp.]
MNEILNKKTVDEIANEVIRGEWGNGAERKEKLTAAGYDYFAVQKRVNEML